MFNRRRFSSLIQVSKEVSNALQKKLPVVSLESTIITHGLPYPRNLEMALKVEQEIRKLGVIPATIAFIDGVPKVGLSIEELTSLAKSSSSSKVSRRDIPYVIANKMNGGTTISGTMIISDKVGIKIFATGGLGGVHRDGQNTMDISADLDELGKTPVAVVCSGPKSILDIERTMEYLETKGVLVGTLGPNGTNVPGFYTRDSGVKSAYNFSDFSKAAEIIKSGDLMGLHSGYLFCIPPPKEVALDSQFINKIIDSSIAEADRSAIKGKELTPFLLSKIAAETKGKSVETNIEFVLNNARSAAQIALSYYDSVLPEDTSASGDREDLGLSFDDTTYDSLVIGSIALDTYCKLDHVVMHDSNPSQITTSIGGVGYNVALESFKSGNKSLKFVSIVGDDLYGKNLLSNLTLSNSVEIADGHTSQYISFHDQKGDLVISGADMSIIERLSTEFVSNEIMRNKPKFVLMDSNISTEMMNRLIESSSQNGFKLIYEPTSFIKSKKLSNCKIRQPIFLATPTIAELEAMYHSFDEQEKFELDYWFPIIDSMGIDGDFRNKVETFVMRNPNFEKIISRGILQLGVSLLPFIETLLIKDGAEGVYLLSLCRESSITPKPMSEGVSFSFVSKGGVLFEHHAVPKKIDYVKNVTGAGDAFVGYLLKELTTSPTFTPGNNLLTGDSRLELINAAQAASAKKIRSD